MLPSPSDTDQSGNYAQIVNVYLGPTLGWAPRRPLAAQSIITAGIHEVNAGVNIVYVNVAGLVTVNLPDVEKWLKQQVQYKPNGFEGSIWIKDLGYHAQAFNITINPYLTQTIDGLAGIDFTIIQDGQLLRLYPLNDLSGWIAG